MSLATAFRRPATIATPSDFRTCLRLARAARFLSIIDLPTLERFRPAARGPCALSRTAHQCLRPGCSAAHPFLSRKIGLTIAAADTKVQRKRRRRKHFRAMQVHPERVGLRPRRVRPALLSPCRNVHLPCQPSRSSSHELGQSVEALPAASSVKYVAPPAAHAGYRFSEP